MNNVRCALSCLVWRCMERKSRRVARLLRWPTNLGRSEERGSRRAAPEPGVLVHGHACYRSLKGQHSTLLRLWYMYRTLCQLQLAPRQDVCVSCPSLSTARTLAPRLCVARRALRNCDAATLSRRSEGEQLSFPERANLGLCFCATGVLLDHLGGTAAPPATCGSAHARCDWGRGPLS